MRMNRHAKKIAYCATLLVPALFTVTNEANAFPKVPFVAHAPHIIKPNTPFENATGLTPAQIRMAYGFNNLPFQGEGQTIAIVDAYDNPNAEADLGVFNQSFNLPACTTANGCFKKIYAAGTQPASDVGWGVEINLDVQWAHAMAPKAKILLVEASDNSFNALFQAISVAVANGANVVSMSWGGGEFPQETSFDSAFSNANVAFVAASGDGGHGTIYPSVSPNVIAVGGTTLSVDTAGNYLGEKAWAGSGGGLSAYEKEPAYQTNFPLPNNPNQMRGVPDISFNADPNSGMSVYDSYGYSGWLVVGGTSAGAPQISALLAVARSGSHKKLTSLNSLIYTVAKNKYSLTLNDIATGTNGTCGYYCTAQTGYDYVTGLGTPQAEYLAYELIFDGLRNAGKM